MRVRAAHEVATRWNELGIEYVVAHGAESYPHAIGRDLDIHMDQEDAPRALLEARRTLAELGWATFVCPPSLWGARLVALTPDGAGGQEYLELHTIPRFTWLALPLKARRIPTSWIGPFPMNSWTTFAKAVLLPLLAGDLAKFSASYLEATWASMESAELVEQELSALVGAKQAVGLMHAVASADATQLAELRRVVRSQCLRHMLIHPVSTATGVWPFFKKRVGRAFSNAGARVLLTTPKGVDGRSLALAVADQLDHIFVSTRVEGPQGFVARFGQRYSELSRQGIVIEVLENGAAAQIDLEVTGGYRGSRATGSFSTNEGSEVLSNWILARWAQSMPCS